MSEPTLAPHVRARRGRRTYGLTPTQARRLKLDGDIWLMNRNGIVIYENELVPEGDGIGQRIWIAPRDVSIGIFPGFWPPVERFSKPHMIGEWVPIDWIREPRKLPHRDPRIGRILFMRRVFYEIKPGFRSGRMRAHDIWPQPDQSGPLWPWEPRRFKT